MCNWLKSLFGKKCHCEGGCCGDKKAEVSPAPQTEAKVEAATETAAPKEEIKA
ncbi:MAG: hypothetical protein WCK59_04435 [Candidatus Falkowbacteria bacterium]